MDRRNFGMMGQEFSMLSQYTLNASQPYNLTAEFNKGAFANIPGTVWQPDLSLVKLNQPNMWTDPVIPGRCIHGNGRVMWKTR